MNGPTTQPPAAPAPDPKVLEIIERGDYVAMLRSCLPTLNSELLAARYMLAELTHEGDVQVKKRQFMKAAGKIQGGLPPMTESALGVIAAGKRG